LIIFVIAIFTLDREPHWSKHYTNRITSVCCALLADRGLQPVRMGENPQAACYFPPLLNKQAFEE
jgi:hypothetical protein